MISRVQHHLKAMAVVGMGAIALLGNPTEASAFGCPISTCMINGVCPSESEMSTWCTLSGCSTDLHNCGSLFNCTGDRVLFYCGTPVDQ